MAWTAPRTWVTDEIPGASEMNTHVRDNMNETAPAKVTTKGDLTPATGANAIARLAAGTDGYGLSADSSQTTGLVWTPRPYGLDQATTITTWDTTTLEKTLYTKDITQSLYVSSKNRTLHFRAICAVSNNSGGNCVFTYKFKHGATVLTYPNITVPNGYTGWCPVWIEAFVVGNGATNAQIVCGTRPSYIDNAMPVDTTGTVDSTAAATVALTCTMDTSHSTSKNRIVTAFLEMITN